MKKYLPFTCSIWQDVYSPSQWVVRILLPLLVLSFVTVGVCEAMTEPLKPATLPGGEGRRSTLSAHSFPKRLNLFARQDENLPSIGKPGGQNRLERLAKKQADPVVEANLDTPCVPVSYTLCGAKTSFTLTAGSGYTSVQWYKDGTVIAGATATDYVATVAGMYSYSAVDATTSCSTSLCCPISIESCAPCVPISYTLCGAKTSFTLTAGSGYTNVQWYKDGTVIAGATATDYVATVAGMYSYSAVDATTSCSTSLCCPISIESCAPCVPASYTLCGTKTSFTLTTGEGYTSVQWYKDGVAIPGATATDYVATVAGMYSYSAVDATGCSGTLCCPVSITACPIVCEKPILTVGNPVCNGSGFYSVSIYSSAANIVATAGVVSGLSVINIPVGTPVSVSASNGIGCYNVAQVDSPTGCNASGPNGCTPPQLTVGQPLCMGTTYTVSYRLTGSGTVTSNVGVVNASARRIEQIPVGTNVVVTATGSGTCVTRVTVVSPASCNNPCENPAITLSGPECSNGATSYVVNYTVNPGTTVLVSAGTVSNGLISGIPSGIPLSVTVTTVNGCSPMVVVVPPASCTVCTALGLNTGTTLALCGQSNGIATVVVNAGSGVAPYTYQWTNAQGTVVSSNSVAQGLAAGMYTVTVTDSKGCTGQKVVTISSTNAPAIVAQAVPTSCGLANGSASVQVTSGSGNYTYQWTTSTGTVVGSSASVANLAAGTYMVNVVDANGCNSMTSVVVGTSTPLVVVATPQNAVCGQANGSISAQVSGGSPSYTYQWRTASGVVATSQNLTNAAPGSYSVVITDATGCTALATANISNVVGPQVSGVPTNVKCYGTQTGSVVLTVSGDTPPIGYVWSNGSTSKDLTNVGAGVYTVTARDANGCMAIQSFTISQPTEIAAIFQPTYPTCTSLTGGSISLVSISGGTAPYSYTWSTGATTASISNLSGGIYTLTIQDGNGCMASPVAVLPTPSNCAAFDLALTKKLSSGQSATVVAGGQVTFTVTVINQGGVDATNVQVTDYIPAGLTLNDANWTASNGKATLNALIASLPAGQSTTRNITFTVSNSFVGSLTNTAEISSASGGTDKDSTPDDNPDNDGTPVNDDTSGDHKNNPSQDEDDSDIEVITVTPLCTALGLNTGTTLALCGQSNGIATVVVNAGSGVAPYSYAWTNASGSVVSSSSIAQGLAPGVYTITVTDSKGCVGQKQVTISSTSAPVILAQASPTACGAPNGSASVNVLSGTGNYTYQWTTSAGIVVGTGTSVLNLSAGTYMVSVADGSGCSSTTSVVVGNSSPVTVVATAQNAVCGQATGSISLQVSGGSGSYSYQWRNAAGTLVATSQNLVNVAPGSYSVTVSDATGCVGVTSANISNLAGPQLSGVVTNVTCFGTQTGSVMLTVNGGTPPIGYQWSNGSTSKDLVNVGAGVYTVTARDANGCMAVQSFTVVQPTEIAAVFQPTQPTCASVNGGSVSLVSISGGTAPYSYTWSNGSTASSISNLSGGTYMLTIKDANGCVASPVAVLITPTGCNPQVCEKPVLTVGNPVCNGSGFYSVSVYTSSTNIVASAGTVSGLSVINIPVGTPVSVSASTGLGCYNIAQVDSPTSCNASGPNGCTPPQLTVGQPLCMGTTYTVSYRLVGSGGITSNVGVVNASAHRIEQIPVGTNVVVTATGSGTCVTRVTVVSPVSCSNPCENPAISLSGPECSSGATYVVSYTVNPGTTVLVSAGSVSGGLISGIPSGIPLSLTVTTANGCSPKVVVVPPASCTVCTALGLNTGTTLALCGQSNGIATVVVNAGSGVAPYSYAWTNASGSVVSSSSIAQGLAPGVYTVTVTDSKGCVGQKQVTISSTSAPVILAQASPTACGAPNGSASVNVLSGTGSYTYQWTTSAGVVVGSSASVLNLAAGTYQVSVADGSGCSSTTSVVVGNSSPVTVVATTQNAVCGQATGSISLQVSGGSGSYSYQWRNAAGSLVATSQNLVNAAPGSYSVSVSDATGCVGVASANISNLAGPQLSGVVTNVKCFGTQTGSVVLSVTGGTPPIGYQWSNGSTSKDLTNVGAGVYTVTARDANGCMAVQSFTVVQPTEIAAVFQPTQPTCTSLNGGSVSLVSISGGTAPYSYTWSTGSTASSISNLSGGTYRLTIQDANGCVASPVAVLTTPTDCSTPVFDLALTKKLAPGQPAHVVAGSNVTFTVTVINQGNVDATSVQVTDYIPTGLTLNDANWTASNGMATLNTPIAGLAAGQS
ncbi:hypothetical protein, partial [Spirosoma litoris]